MKKELIAAMVMTAMLTMPVQAMQAKEINHTFDAFVTSAELSYNAKMVNIEFSLYAVNMGSYDCGDGDNYRISVPVKEINDYTLGRDYSVTLDNVQDGIIGNETVVSVQPQDTYVWTWSDDYEWTTPD